MASLVLNLLLVSCGLHFVDALDTHCSDGSSCSSARNEEESFAMMQVSLSAENQFEATDGAKTQVQAETHVSSANNVAGNAVAKGAAAVKNQVDKDPEPHTRGQVASGFYATSLIVVFFTIGGLMLDLYFCPDFRSKPQRFPFWLGGLFIGSYLILIPGIVSTIFSVRLLLNEPISGKTLAMINNRFTGEPGDLIESMWTILAMLFKSGSITAGVLVSFYGIAVPVVKGLLLLLGEFWRDCEDDDTCAHLARLCVLAVQFVSKWDSPKLICYILIISLVHMMNFAPTVVAQAHLDVGFAYYAVFCLATLFGSLCIPLPTDPYEEEKKKTGRFAVPYFVRVFGMSGAACMASMLAVVAAALLFLGMNKEVASIRFDPLLPAAVVPKVAWDDTIRANVAKLGIGNWAKCEMTMWSAIQTLWTLMISEPNVNITIAFVLMTVFVFSFTVLDLIVLVVAAWQVQRDCAISAGKEKKRPLLWQAKNTMAVSHCLKYLSMLDVCLTGAIIMGVSTSTSYGHCGIIVKLRDGLLWLLAAEIVHYLVYFIVEGAVKHASDKKNRLSLPEPDPEPERESPETAHEAEGCEEPADDGDSDGEEAGKYDRIKQGEKPSDEIVPTK